VCTGLYETRFDIQLTAENFYISLRGRGGIRSYKLRFDDKPAEGLALPDSVRARCVNSSSHRKQLLSVALCETGSGANLDTY
jgi:hypothetical protein